MNKCVSNYQELSLITSEIVDDAEYILEGGGKLWISWGAEKQENKYTDVQRKSLHVWCRQCAQVLNDSGITCEVLHPFTKQVLEMPWTMELFKNNLYKFVLEAMTGKTSTEDQSTVDPSEVALVISKRYAENGLICPPWPNSRG